MSWNFNLTSRTPENSKKCGFLKIIKITVFTKNWGIFMKNWVKNHVSWCIWVTHTLCIGFQYFFDNVFFQIFRKWSYFWLNWKCLEGSFTISSTFLQQILQNLSKKISMEKKVPWHQPGPTWARGPNCHFCQKNPFFGQKMAFLWRVHFIQKWTVTQNTVFQWVKNNFLLALQKS